MSVELAKATTTADCGHETISDGFATGSAIIKRNGFDVSMCYRCADADQRLEIATSNDIYAYVGSHTSAGFITSWSGGALMTITSAYVCTHSGWNRSEIWSVSAVDRSGARWYGRNGGPGMAIRLKRSKETPIGYGNAALNNQTGR